jgi:hypothetical protein
VILFVLVVAFLFTVPLVIWLIIITRRAWALDAIFKPLGLEGRTYMLYGRQFHGMVNGRELDVYIFRGPTVELHLKTSVQASLNVFDKNSISVSTACAFDKRPLSSSDPALNHLVIYTIDESWAYQLLEQEQSVEAIHALMSQGADWAIFRRVELLPGEVHLNLNCSKSWWNNPIDEGKVRAWLTSMHVLAKIAESLPAPEVRAKPTDHTRQSRQRMSIFSPGRLLQSSLAFLCALLEWGLLLISLPLIHKENNYGRFTCQHSGHHRYPYYHWSHFLVCKP